MISVICYILIQSRKGSYRIPVLRFCSYVISIKSTYNFHIFQFYVLVFMEIKSDYLGIKNKVMYS